MAIDKQPRLFTLHVVEVDCNLMTDDRMDEHGVDFEADAVQIVYHGKVRPSVKTRIETALREQGKLIQHDRSLA